VLTLTAQQEGRAAALHRDPLIIDTLSGEPMGARIIQLTYNSSSGSP